MPIFNFKNSRGFLRIYQLGQKATRKILSIKNSILIPFIISNVYKEHENSIQIGSDFEEFDPNIGHGADPRAIVIAYYLPQFHAFDDNDKNWGKGFTEWTNIPRSSPRFKGHLQPKIPRDFGYYNLLDGKTQHDQEVMARNAGLHGFCYYYYWLDNKPVMQLPLETKLNDNKLDLPFCLMWCNENWTRTWHGKDSSILLKQKYDYYGIEQMIDHLAQFMKDGRYIKLKGRPLLYIYRVENLENRRNLISLIRNGFNKRHNLDPLLFMSQAEGANVSPIEYGLDGAVEFLPGKFKRNMRKINDKLKIYDKDFSSVVYDYNELISKSLNDNNVDFPLIRGLMPGWDNSPRRPGKGMIIHRSSPKKFNWWANKIIENAIENPTFDTPTVIVNAWNEWAEGAVLEPDTHYGGAYLNALSRAIFGKYPKYNDY
ncbi:MAG: lipopolysaccharide biosynthesis protein [Salibacteraceae bacterium]|jgi:lipopolysaccharide biosynthesis protein